MVDETIPKEELFCIPFLPNADIDISAEDGGGSSSTSGSKGSITGFSLSEVSDRLEIMLHQEEDATYKCFDYIADCVTPAVEQQRRLPNRSKSNDILPGSHLEAIRRGGKKKTTTGAAGEGLDSLLDNNPRGTLTRSNSARSELTSMTNTQFKPINEKCRLMMVKWCYEIVDICKLQRETVAYCFSYLDRYLCRGCNATTNNTANKTKYKHSVEALFDRSQYQIACMTCLYLGIKLHEEKVIDTDLLEQLSLTKHTQNDFALYEQKILQALGWRVNGPTPLSFIRCFITLMPSSVDGMIKTVIYDYSQYQCELSIFYYNFVNYNPSEIAFASILNATMDIDDKILNLKTKIDFITTIEKFSTNLRMIDPKTGDKNVRIQTIRDILTDATKNGFFLKKTIRSTQPPTTTSSTTTTKDIPQQQQQQQQESYEQQPDESFHLEEDGQPLVVTESDSFSKLSKHQQQPRKKKPSSTSTTTTEDSNSSNTSENNNAETGKKKKDAPVAPPSRALSKVKTTKKGTGTTTAAKATSTAKATTTAAAAPTAAKRKVVKKATNETTKPKTTTTTAAAAAAKQRVLKKSTSTSTSGNNNTTTTTNNNKPENKKKLVKKSSFPVSSSNTSEPTLSDLRKHIATTDKTKSTTAATTTTATTAKSRGVKKSTSAMTSTTTNANANAATTKRAMSTAAKTAPRNTTTAGATTTTKARGVKKSVSSAAATSSTTTAAAAAGVKKKKATATTTTRTAAAAAAVRG